MNRKYRCMKCRFQWEGWRVLWHECLTIGPWKCPTPCPKVGTGKRYRDAPLRGGMTECPKCKSLYVDWVNARQGLKALGSYWLKDTE